MDADRERVTSPACLHESANAVALALHQNCRRFDPAQFLSWALGQVRRIIPFDSALWASGAIAADRSVIVHRSYLDRLPESMWADYLPIAQFDMLSHAIAASPGKTVALPVAEAGPEMSPQLMAFLRKYDIGHGLATMCVDPITQLSTAISLYRSFGNRPFNAAEAKAQELLMPHLIESASANALAYLGRMSRSGQRAPFATAIVDRQLLLRAADAQFAPLLRTEWPQWQGPAVPIEIAPMIRRHEGASYAGNSIVIGAQPLDDQVLLRVRGAVTWDRLGQREGEVARLVGKGLSQKQVAVRLRLSPSTVHNHLCSVYRKLDVRSKTQLSALIAPLEW